MKMVVEPTGCLAFAAACAALEGGAGKGERIGVIVSGGNVDMARYAELLA
jgi:threonine dehydratase